MAFENETIIDLKERIRDLKEKIDNEELEASVERAIKINIKRMEDKIKDGTSGR